MKINKKILLSLLLVLLLLTACGTKDEGNVNNPEVNEPTEEMPIAGVETPITKEDFTDLTTESDLEAIIMGLYTASDIDADFLEMISNFHMITSFNKDDISTQKVYFGDVYDFKEAKVSESGISTSAYSLMLVRANDASQAQKLAQDIAKSVNPNKWICVTAETVVTAVNKDLALVIMGEQKQVNAMIETFKTLP